MLELYFDESGNTGTNYLDPAQPYFIYGGWLINSDKADKISEEFRKIFVDSKAKEQKFQNGLKLFKIDSFFSMMYKYNSLPIFGIADKKFMVAAKIIETFFDHYYNPYVNGFLTCKSELKKALADCVSQNECLLITFSKIIHDGTIALDEMKEIKVSLSEHFKKEGLLMVSETIEKLSESNLKEMIGEFESVSKFGKEKRWLSLVEPVLFDRIINVDRYAELIHEKVDLYVDELWGYQNVFDELENIVKNNTLIKNFNFIKQCKSTENIFIQAADLLCGFINNSLMSKENFNKKEIVSELWNRFFELRCCFEYYKINIWDYYAHSDFINKLSELIKFDGSKVKTNYVNIIERDFPIALKGHSQKCWETSSIPR